MRFCTCITHSVLCRFYFLFILLFFGKIYFGIIMEIKRLWETYAPWKDINADIKYVRECNFATLFLWTVEGSDSKTRWVLAIDGKREEVSLSCTPCITDTPWTSVYKASASKNWNKWDSLPWFSVPGQFVRYKTKQKKKLEPVHCEVLSTHSVIIFGHWAGIIHAEVAIHCIADTWSYFTSISFQANLASPFFGVWTRQFHSLSQT